MIDMTMSPARDLGAHPSARQIPAGQEWNDAYDDGPVRRRRKAADAVVWAGAIAVGVVVGLWTLTLSSASWASPAALAVAIADLSGLVGVALLLGSVLLVSRITALERVVGLDKLTAWHRKLAPYGAYLITVHVVLSIIGYGGQGGKSFLPQAWQFVTGWQSMLPAYGGFFLLIGAGITSWRYARRRFTYETWWVVHLYTYLAIGLSLLHQINDGTSFAGHTLVRYGWIGVHLAVLAAILLWRVGLPIYRSVRHDLRVESVQREAAGSFSLVLRGRRLSQLPLQGGQFIHLRIGRRGLWWQAHPYSVSGLPWNDRMRFTISDSGDYAREIMRTAPGTRVLIEGPYGAFTTASAQAGRPLLLVAGGVGVTPIRTILDELPAGSRPVVIYRSPDQAEVMFREELEALVAARGGVLHVLAGRRDQYPIDAPRLYQAVPDIRDREVFVCGNDSLVAAVRRAVTQCGVPGERFHAEEFAW